MSCKATFMPKDVLIIGYYEGPVVQDLAKRVITEVYDNQIMTAEELQGLVLAARYRNMEQEAAQRSGMGLGQ